MRTQPDYPFDTTVVWHVVFHPGRLLWSSRFRHVSLAGYSNETWIHLDLNRTGLSISPIYHYQEVDDFLTYILAYYTVVRFGPAQVRPHFLAPMSCVSFVKHALGVRSGALLPDGLFRSLTRNHGCEVINARQQAEGDARAEAAAAYR